MADGTAHGLDRVLGTDRSLPRCPTMLNFETFIGAAAAFCTTVCNVPQLQKCWETGQTHDLSLKMLLMLAAGLVLWLVYGFMRGDTVIIIANVASLALVVAILGFKIRAMYAGPKSGEAGPSST